MTQRDPTPAAFSMRLGAKKRKHCDSNHANTTSKATPCAAFLSQTQLDGMSDYDYADMTMDVQPSSSHILSLEDAAAKVKRLKAEGNTLAEAGLFRAAVARFQHGLDIDPDNGVLYELQAQAYLASNDYFRGIEAATRATELCPEWSDGFATLAHCQFNFGELDLAHAAMLKAWTLEQDACQKQQWQAELDDMASLLAVQTDNIATIAPPSTVALTPDEHQVRTCKANLCRRSVHWPS
ncbi:hypothetical protein, variant [Aphanomyces invadans]|uniref:Uncharacterized protein n=1 Tax=Aphanomyces invadans TaxID=157072 RepID=A0A024TZG7_9STRA|nr:hypothetical protein, variant [Aphanomyces invadans]ETV99560.1 hypothetical protein, variant [Aphanomyces invadans]|eukprot:XP_008872116.1 hypothetical protein, variant [Aphanomyces invadans]